MSHTLTIRLRDELLAWLKETSRRTGVPMGRLIRQKLESAKAASDKQGFVRHVGAIIGPPGLSSRKGVLQKMKGVEREEGSSSLDLACSRQT